jgi:hypothetical protein
VLLNFVRTHEIKLPSHFVPIGAIQTTNFHILVIGNQKMNDLHTNSRILPSFFYLNTKMVDEGELQHVEISRMEGLDHSLSKA